MKKLLITAMLVLMTSSAWSAVELDSDANGGIDVSKGGTNATTVSGARTSLGLGTGDNPSFSSVHASGGNLAAANAQVTKKWITGLSYAADVTSVIHGGKHFICSSTHTAGSTTEPGIGASWATVWKYAGDAVHPYGDNTIYTQDSQPAACATGDMWVDTNGTSGQRIYTCESTNTWVAQAGGGGYTNLTSFVAQTPWRIFYSNTDGDVTELALGADGTYLKSNGASAAPTWATPSGSMVYPGSGIPNSTGSAWGTSYTLDTDLSSVSASDDTIPSAKSTKALFDSLPALTWGTGLTDTSSTISVTYPVSAEAFSGSGWNGDTGGLTRNDAYDQLHIGDSDDDGKHDALDDAVIIPDGGTLTFDESAADPDDADVRLSGTDGVFKLAAVNGANNEDLAVDLDATANKAKYSSSTGLTLITTGSIPFTGAIRTVGKSSDYTIGNDDADEAYGAIFLNTGASTRVFTLPSAVAGMSVCVRNSQGVSQIIRLDAASGDYIVKSTGARTSASGEYYGATADAKNQLCVVAYDATDWYVTSEVGTWTEE